MAAETSGSSSSADPYTGRLIRLITEDEIRYEGNVANIDTEKSRIRLKNVRLFGTQGRKKDGTQQVGPSDEVIEEMLFQLSNIEDFLEKLKQATETDHRAEVCVAPTVLSEGNPNLETSENESPVNSEAAQSGSPDAHSLSEVQRDMWSLENICLLEEKNKKLKQFYTELETRANKLLEVYLESTVAFVLFNGGFAPYYESTLVGDYGGLYLSLLVCFTFLIPFVMINTFAYWKFGEISRSFEDFRRLVGRFTADLHKVQNAGPNEPSDLENPQTDIETRVEDLRVLPWDLDMLRSYKLVMMTCCLLWCLIAIGLPIVMGLYMKFYHPNGAGVGGGVAAF